MSKDVPLSTQWQHSFVFSYRVKYHKHIFSSLCSLLLALSLSFLLWSVYMMWFSLSPADGGSEYVQEKWFVSGCSETSILCAQPAPWRNQYFYPHSCSSLHCQCKRRSWEWVPCFPYLCQTQHLHSKTLTKHENSYRHTHTHTHAPSIPPHTQQHMQHPTVCAVVLLFCIWNLLCSCLSVIEWLFARWPVWLWLILYGPLFVSPPRVPPLLLSISVLSCCVGPFLLLLGSSLLSEGVGFIFKSLFLDKPFSVFSLSKTKAITYNRMRTKHSDNVRLVHCWKYIFFDLNLIYFF